MEPREKEGGIELCDGNIDRLHTLDIDRGLQVCYKTRLNPTLLNIFRRLCLVNNTQSLLNVWALEPFLPHSLGMNPTTLGC